MRLPRDPFDREAQDLSLADALESAQNTAIYLGSWQKFGVVTCFLTCDTHLCFIPK